MNHSTTVGCSKEDLDTPALCLDLDVMDANIHAMVTACHRHGVGWRPHAKCHKSSLIARWLIEAGAVGVTCAKLGEAETMAAGGVRDLLIANMLVGRRKLARLAELTRVADPIVCVDHIDQANAISQMMDSAQTTTRVLVELDIGMRRTGVPPGRQALRLAETIVKLPGIRFAGLMAYEGHLLTIEDADKKAAAIRMALGEAVETKRQLETRGIACPILSCGGTGSYVVTVAQPGITEIQAGGAIFMDAFYRHRCHVNHLQYALTVISTVVSRPSPDRAIIDAGRKTLNAEIHMPRVFGRDDIEVDALSAEHGILRVGRPSGHPKIGERIELIPGYADLTVNLHDQFYGFRQQKLARIIPIEARGKVQ